MEAPVSLEALMTKSRKYGDDFIINGQKIFITNAHKADYLLTLLRTDAKAAKRSKSLSLFLVPVRNNPGIEIVPLKKFTIKGASACEIFFENARVPGRNQPRARPDHRLDSRVEELLAVDSVLENHLCQALRHEKEQSLCRLNHQSKGPAYSGFSCAQRRSQR
jgi:hypothetical protein